MKTYYYNLDDGEFIYPSGDRCNVVPELFYQENAVWRIALRDRKDLPVDISGVSAWGAAVDHNYCSGSVPMCRTLAEDIRADIEAGAVEVAIDAATPEFLAAVNGTAMKPAFFELYGLDAAGERVLSLCFEIRARMVLDPDPTISGDVPETVATKVYAAAVASGAAASVRDDLLPQIDARPTSSGARLIAQETVASGGFVKSAAVVSDSVTSSAYIPVLSGGTCYKYGQPLTMLSIGAIADTPAEDVIIFSAGAVTTPPTSMDVWFASAYWDNENWGVTAGSSAITLSSEGGSFTFAPSDYQWCWEERGDERGTVHLSGGSVVGTVNGDEIVISARGVTVTSVFGSMNWMDDQFDVYESGSSTLTGLVASSGDGGATWTFGGILIPSYYQNEDFGALEKYNDGSACEVTNGSTTPCAVVLPSGVDLVGSSKIELASGHRYEMNIANGGIVMAERFAVAEPEAPHGYFYVGDGVADNFRWNADRSVYAGEQVTELYITVAPDGDDLRLVLTNGESDLCTGTAPGGDLTNISWNTPDFGIIYYPPEVEA